MRRAYPWHCSRTRPYNFIGLRKNAQGFSSAGWMLPRYHPEGLLRRERNAPGSPGASRKGLRLRPDRHSPGQSERWPLNHRALVMSPNSTTETMVSPSVSPASVVTDTMTSSTWTAAGA